MPSKRLPDEGMPAFLALMDPTIAYLGDLPLGCELIIKIFARSIFKEQLRFKISLDIGKMSSEALNLTKSQEPQKTGDEIVPKVGAKAPKIYESTGVRTQDLDRCSCTNSRVWEG